MSSYKTLDLSLDAIYKRYIKALELDLENVRKLTPEEFLKQGDDYDTEGERVADYDSSIVSRSREELHDLIQVTEDAIDHQYDDE